MKSSPAARSLVQSSRVFTLWMILMLAFAMLPAQPAQDAAAQTPTPTATPEAEQEEEEEEEAGPTPTNTVVAEVNGGPTIDVIIRKRICPPGFDPENLNNQDLFDACNVDATDETVFIVSSTGGSIENPQRLAGSAGPGTVYYTAVPFGNVFIGENNPPEYGESVVNCAAYAAYNATQYIGDESAGTYAIPHSPANNAINVTFDVNDANINNGQYPYFFCYWYNFPPADEDVDGEGTSLHITKFLCPPGYDAENAQLSDLESDCDQRHQGISFDVIDSSGEAQGTQTTDQNGEVRYDGLPFGDVDVFETAPEGYATPKVYCKVHPITDANTVIEQSDEVSPESVEGSTFIYFLNAPEGNKIDCHWFNVPPADAEVDGEGGNVYINKYLCPPDYDYAAANISQLDGECTTPHEGAFFTVLYEGGGHFGPIDASGHLELTGLPFGTWTVREDAEPGYIMGRAYCYIQQPGVPNGLLTDDAEVPISTETEGYYIVTYDVPEGYELHCYFYNVPAEDGDQPGSVEVTKYICPEEYDYSSSDLESLLDNCTTPHEGAGINLFLPGEALYGGGTEADGNFEWEDIRPGSVTLRELTDGYAMVRVYCHAFPTGVPNTVTGEYEESSIYRDGEFYHADAHLPSGYTIHCYLFNAPVEDDFGTVYVYKYICHPDFDYQEASREDLDANCTEPHEGVPFGVGSESAEYQEERATDSSGTAIWEDVPAGGIGILEGEHEGYVLVGVYCGVVAQNNATLPGSWEEVSYQDGLDYHLPAGEYVHCIFYNAPDPDHGSIVITKYLCGLIQVAIDSGGPDYNVFSNQCQDIGVGYVFSLQTATADVPGESDENGEARWTGLDPGDVTVSETLPTGYDSYAVYCTTDPSGTYDEYAGEQDLSFDYTVSAGETLYCSWFNYVPNSNTHVEVVKYLCPPDYDYEAADYPTISGACTETISEVPFLVYNADVYNSPKVTNEEGTATWSSVPAGPISIQETPGPDYLPVKVYCELSPIEGPESGLFQGYDLDFEDYFIEIGVPDGQSLVCHWFNLPVEVGTVVIYKYTCELFLTRGEAGYDDYVENCTTPGQGFTFGLYDSADELVDEQTTGPDGSLTLNTAAAGSYLVLEEALSGYIGLAVYCTEDASVPPTTEADSPLALDFAPGTTYYCYWFNYPYEESPYEPGSIVIHKYNCPPGYPTEPQGGRSAQGWFFDGCLVAASGVSFNAEQGGNTVGSGETDASGTAVIAGVSPGTTRISELPREGYSPPKVFCANYPVTNGTVLFAFDEQTVDNWGHTIELVEGNILECYWFNLPSGQGEEGQPIQLIVHKYLCAPEFEYTGQPYESISAECTTEEEGVNFDVIGGDGGTSDGPTDVNGYAEYNGVASGGISITETPRDGYQTLAVYCTAYISTPGTPSLYPTTDSQLSYYVADGYTLECYWYNIEAVDYGNVSVFKYICPEGYDYEAASRDDLAQTCTEQYEGVQYFMSGPDNYAEDRSTSQFGLAEWESVPPASYSMHETPSPGYYPVRIFCSEVPIDSPLLYEAGFSGTWEDFTASPDNILDIQLEVQAGYWWWCEWFNAPVEDEAWVDVIKYVCPTDYDYATRTQDQLRNDCFYVAEGVDFTLANGGYSEPRTTDSDGRADWDDVPIETLTLSESSTELAPARIFCTQAEGEDSEPPQLPWTDYSGVNEINLDIQSGYHVYCEWFNYSDVGTIKIYKYFCEQEYDYVSRDDYHSVCANPQESVHFDVAGQWGSAFAGDSDQNGLITWEGAPHGPVTMTETPPVGYIPWKVFCSVVQSEADTPSTWDPVPIDFSVNATYPVTANYYVTCEWYNLPYEEAPPQVWVYKYNCPEGADHAWTYHQFLSNCTDPAPNVEFGAGPDLGALSLVVTDAQGKIVFGDIDPGPLYLQESLPGGYGGFVVYCQFSYQDVYGTYQRIPVYDSAFALELENDYIVTCYVFDLPTGHEPPAATPPAGGHPPTQPTFPGGSGGGTGDPRTVGVPATGAGTSQTGQPAQQVEPDAPANLIITKFTCPNVYDVHAAGSDPVVDCDTPTNEVPFALADGEDIDEEGLTGDDGEGTVAFNDLPAGPYLLAEEPPEGTIAAFIYTCESDLRDFQLENPFTPFAYAGPDGRIGVTLIPGETLECAWYDVPEEQAGGQVTVIKYACPGTSVTVSQCVIYPDGATVGLFPVGDSGEIVELETGEDGTATAAVEGTYTVQELPTTACLIDSDAFDLAGNLVVNEGDQVEVRVYNCGLQP